MCVLTEQTYFEGRAIFTCLGLLCISTKTGQNGGSSNGGSPEFQLQLFSTSQAFPPPVREECAEISLPARSFITKMQSRLSY